MLLKLEYLKSLAWIVLAVSSFDYLPRWRGSRRIASYKFYRFQTLVSGVVWCGLDRSEARGVVVVVVVVGSDTERGCLAVQVRVASPGLHVMRGEEKSCGLVLPSSLEWLE